MSYKDIIRSLVDPHDTKVAHPKLWDGVAQRSAGLRFRNVSEVTCPSTGYGYLVLWPMLNTSGSKVMDDYDDTSDVTKLATAKLPYFGEHGETALLRDSIRSYRVVGAQMRLTLLNSPDEADGMFESVRIQAPVALAGDIVTDDVVATAVHTKDFIERNLVNMENHPSYVQGRLRDIHRYNFRCNFTDTNGNGPGFFPTDVYHSHPDWDCIIIRIKGRSVSGNPSVLSVDTVTNQEIQYTATTSLARLMTINSRLGDMYDALLRMRFLKSALKVG